MNNGLKSYEDFLNKKIESVMATCLVSSVEILKNDFGFTKEQLNKFADKFVPTLKKNLNNK